MLYEDEVVQVDVDAATGFMEPEEQIEIARLNGELESAEAFSNLLDTAGYKKLEEWMYEQINACKEKLLDAELSPERITELRQLQQHARAYSNLIGFVRNEASKASFLKEQAENLSHPQED